jgi:hypothetical protein
MKTVYKYADKNGLTVTKISYTGLMGFYKIGYDLNDKQNNRIMKIEPFYGINDKWKFYDTINRVIYFGKRITDLNKIDLNQSRDNTVIQITEL